MSTHAYNIRKASRRARRSSRNPVRLPHLDIELTERCDNNCIHCSINRPPQDAQARARELTASEWKGILSQAADLQALTVRFTGGEPLLRDDFEDIYLHARRLGLRVVLFTNARNLTERRADLLARHPPLEPVEVSVYGMRPATYEAVSRVRGSFREFWNGIRRLQTRRIPFIVKGALLPQNVADQDRFETWARTLPRMRRPPASLVLFSLRERRDSPARNARIRALRPAPEAVIACLERHADDNRRSLREFCSRFPSPPSRALFPCGAGCTPSVDAYGKLQPCLSLRDPSWVYDVRAVPIREALARLAPRLRRKTAMRSSYRSRCARCFIRGLCEQCPARSWSEHGTLDTPVRYYCHVAHAQARWLGLLPPGEKAWNVHQPKTRIQRMQSEILHAQPHPSRRRLQTV
ncbi:MAG: radical SAM protein [Lentisphaerae bacterium]|nr:radical SAM protein [Lentisphaerota bacterium]